MKKIITFLVISIYFILGYNAYAEGTKKFQNNITWELQDDGKLIISGVGAMPDLSAHKYPWARHHKKITSVMIEEGITRIGANSFNSRQKRKFLYNNLNSVSLPSTLKEIGEYAFYLVELDYLEIPDGVTKIEKYALTSCGLDEIRLPSALKETGSHALAYNNFSRIIIPRNVKSIGEYTFYGNRMTHIEIQEGIHEIQTKAFITGCLKGERRSLSISLPSTLKEIGDDAFANTGAGELVIDKLIIPCGVTKIGEDAFRGSIITSLSVPSTLTSLGRNTFDYINFDKNTRTIIAYNGSRVRKFDINGELLSDSKLETDRENYIALGSKEFEKGNYSNSARYYDSAIAIRPSATLYFNRGVSYYNDNLYAKAIADFRRCLNSNPSQKLIDRSKELIEKSETYLQEKKIEEQNKRRQIARDVVGIIFSAASSAVQYAMINNSTPSYGSYGTSTYFRPESAVLQEFNQGANQIFVQTIVDYENQLMEEFEQFRRYNKHPDGRDYTYNEWTALRGQAIQDMKDQGYDIIAEQREMNRQNNEAWRASLEADRKDRLDRIKEYNNMRTGTTSAYSSSSNSSSSNYSSSSTSSSSSYSSSISSSGTSYNSSTTSSANEQTMPEYDAKQQFKTQGVYSDDYEYKKKVTLYTRNGDNAKVMFNDKDLCKKGAYYYVKIDNKYYSVNYSNWSRFDKSIIYGHESLYFNL